MSYNPLDSQSDCFKPPETPVEVECLHCGRRYQSNLIEWRVETSAEGDLHGFWCCPIPGCDGRGFGFDILPTDPEYHDEHGGWVSCDDDEAKPMLKHGPNTACGGKGRKRPLITQAALLEDVCNNEGDALEMPGACCPVTYHARIATRRCGLRFGASQSAGRAMPAIHPAAQ